MTSHRITPLLFAPLALLAGCAAAPPPAEPEPPPATGEWRDLVGTWDFDRPETGGAQAARVSFTPIEDGGTSGLRFSLWRDDAEGEPDNTAEVYPGRVTEASSSGPAVAGGEAVGWRALYELIDGRLVVTYQWQPSAPGGEGGDWLGVAVGECYAASDTELAWRRLGVTYASSDDPSGSGLEGWESLHFYERVGP